MVNEYDKLELFKVRDMGQMMGFAANLVRRHWKHMFRTIGLMSLPLMLMASTLYYLGSSAVWEGLNPAMGLVRTNPIGMNMLLAYVAMYITYCTLFWGSVYYIQLYQEKGPENFQWNDIWAKVFAHGWWLILSNLIILTILVLLSMLSSILVITVVLAPVAFILIATIYAFTQLWTVTYLFEGKNLFNALNRTFMLIKENWFKALALFTCSFMVVAGIIMLPGYLVYMGGLISGNIGLDENFIENSLWIILLFQNLFVITLFLATFYISMCFTAFYLSNVERLEKVSLKKRVECLSEDSTLSSYT